MPVPSDFKVTAQEEKQVKAVIGRRCEICNFLYPFSRLQIHFHTGEQVPENREEADLERRILVLCPLCHQAIHLLAERQDIVYIQKKIVLDRPRSVRVKIRQIFGYQPRPYTPPETIDLAEAFEDALKLENVFRVI